MTATFGKAIRAARTFAALRTQGLNVVNLLVSKRRIDCSCCVSALTLALRLPDLLFVTLVDHQKFHGQSKQSLSNIPLHLVSQMACCLLLTLLPPELRLHIYKYLLRSEGTVRPRTSSPAEYKFRAAILVTCRQINDEAYPVLLSVNTWVIDPIDDLPWLDQIGVLGQSALREVIIVRRQKIYWARLRQFFDFLSGCRQLKLIIRSHCWELRESYRNGTFKYMHGFAKATVALSICPEHAHLEWLEDMAKRTSEDLRKRLMSACPEDCKMHVGRPSSHTKSTVDMGLTNDCLGC